MSNLYSTKQKIAIAKEIIENACGNETTSGYNNPIFVRLRTIEKKYIKSKSYDLSNFCISLYELPKKHFKLMRLIGWLDEETEKPKKYLKGFYSEPYPGKQGTTQIEHYITVDAYVYLLFIELEMIDIYSKVNSSLDYRSSYRPWQNLGISS